MTLILTRGDVAALMRPCDYLEAAESAFRAVGEGCADTPPPLAVHGVGGAFHAKGAALTRKTVDVALKLNANFPGNLEKGLPTIQGALLLCDGSNGLLYAIMDSMEVTLRRTAAATALAAQHLARRDSTIVTICGCGAQASAQLEALRDLFTISQAYCFDRDPARAANFAQLNGAEPVTDLADATLCSDIIVACTTATAAFLTSSMIRPGTFIAAVGTDAPHKSEITPELMESAMVVCDSVDQCLTMGDLHHAVEAGRMTTEDVHALSDLVVGARLGRERDDQITIFDSTGIAAQDVAAAWMIHQRALAACAGFSLDLAA